MRFELIWAQRYENYTNAKPNYLEINNAVSMLRRLETSLNYLSKTYVTLRRNYNHLLACNSVTVKSAIIKTNFCLSLLERELRGDTPQNQAKFAALSVITFLENIGNLTSQLTHEIDCFSSVLSNHAKIELKQFIVFL